MSSTSPTTSLAKALTGSLFTSGPPPSFSTLHAPSARNELLAACVRGWVFVVCAHEHGRFFDTGTLQSLQRRYLLERRSTVALLHNEITVSRPCYRACDFHRFSTHSMAKKSGRVAVVGSGISGLSSAILLQVSPTALATHKVRLRGCATCSRQYASLDLF